MPRFASVWARGQRATRPPGKSQQGACFFFQAEDGIRDVAVTGVQTCALPIFLRVLGGGEFLGPPAVQPRGTERTFTMIRRSFLGMLSAGSFAGLFTAGRSAAATKIGRASCRERV